MKAGPCWFFVGVARGSVIPGPGELLPSSHPKLLSWPQLKGTGLTTHSLPPLYQRGKSTHRVRLTDFLEVTELTSGGLGPEPPHPGTQSDWLSKAWGRMRDELTSSLHVTRPSDAPLASLSIRASTLSPQGREFISMEHLRPGAVPGSEDT